MEQDKGSDEKQYAPPAVIYDGAITTRAGSPLGGGNGDGSDGVDPADLFRN